MGTPVIETPRLQLSALGDADLAELVPLIGAREIAATTLRIPHPYQEKHAREFLASAAKENELRLGIRLRSNGRLCGGIGLTPTRHISAPNSVIGLESRTGETVMQPRRPKLSYGTASNMRG